MPFNMGQPWPLFIFVLFSAPWQIKYNIWLFKTLEGVLGIGTQDHRIVGGDKSTELWRPHLGVKFNGQNNSAQKVLFYEINLPS